MFTIAIIEKRPSAKIKSPYVADATTSEAEKVLIHTPSLGCWQGCYCTMQQNVRKQMCISCWTFSPYSHKHMGRGKSQVVWACYRRTYEERFTLLFEEFEMASTRENDPQFAVWFHWCWLWWMPIYQWSQTCSTCDRWWSRVFPWWMAEEEGWSSESSCD